MVSCQQHDGEPQQGRHVRLSPSPRRAHPAPPPPRLARLFLGERGVRFGPYVGLGGRRLGINDVARRLGLLSLFAHLCKQGIERG